MRLLTNSEEYDDNCDYDDPKPKIVVAEAAVARATAVFAGCAERSVIVVAASHMLRLLSVGILCLFFETVKEDALNIALASPK